MGRFKAEGTTLSKRGIREAAVFSLMRVDGGLGSAVAEVLLEEGAVPAIFYRMGLRGGFSSVVGSQDYLRKHYGINADAIVSTAEGLLNRSRSAAA